MRERRYKTIKMPQRVLVTTFNAWLSPDYFLCLPVTDAVPKDSQVVSVQPNFSCQCVDVVIYHESFPIVPDCELIPVAGLLEGFEVVSVEDILATRGFAVVPYADAQPVVVVNMEDFEGMGYDKMAGYLADECMRQLKSRDPDLYARLGGPV